MDKQMDFGSTGKSFNNLFKQVSDEIQQYIKNCKESYKQIVINP